MSPENLFNEISHIIFFRENAPVYQIIIVLNILNCIHYLVWVEYYQAIDVSHLISFMDMIKLLIKDYTWVWNIEYIQQYF